MDWARARRTHVRCLRYRRGLAQLHHPRRHTARRGQGHHARGLGRVCRGLARRLRPGDGSRPARRSAVDHIDDLHRLILDRLLVEFRIGGLSADEKEHFNRAWHRLRPWPDAVPGLHRLKARYTIATLSNGNVALLTNMAKQAGYPGIASCRRSYSGAISPTRRSIRARPRCWACRRNG